MDLLLIDFHLLRPLWLLVIIPALILIVLMKQQHKKQGQWHQVFPAHLANLLIENKPSATHKTSMTALIITSIIIAISLSGPTWERIEQPLFKIKKAQVVIADMSLSMYSTDILPNRLTRAKFKINDLVSRLGEGDTALLAYAGDAFVISPMTQDVANLKNLIPALNPQIMPVYGSAPSYAIEKALELFSQANHQSGDIYLITDGMDAADAREITQLLKNTQFTLNIMGVGTPQGAPIKLPNDQLLKDDDGNIVIPRLQSSTLRALSKTLSGRYSNLTNDTSDINYLVSPDSTGELSDEQQDNQFGDEWHEMGPYLILFLLPFAALAFRRGIIISCVMVLMLNPMATSPLMAAEIIKPAKSQGLALPNDTLSPKTISPEATSLDTSTVDSWWDNLWQTKNQQALKSFNKNNYEGAAATFEDDQWRGASQYKQGNFEQALEYFDKGKSSQDIFNQANALSQMQQFDQAIKRYESLLKQKPDFPNARENLEIVKQLAKQKKEQQKQDGDQSGEQSDSDEQKNDGQQSDSDEQQQSDNKDSEQQKSDQQSDDSSDQQQSSQSQSDENSEQDSEKKNSEQSDNKNDSENDEQGEGEEKPEPSDEEKEELAKQQQAAKESQQLFNNENLSKDELQRLNQLVKKIPDNPSLLLEAKMAQEARKRKQTRMVTKERKQW